jgi:hypothetical protein
VQRGSLESAVPEGRADVLGLGEIYPAKVTLVEHHPFGAQPAEIIVAEIVCDELPFDPDLFVVAHRLSREAR